MLEMSGETNSGIDNRIDDELSGDEYFDYDDFEIPQKSVKTMKFNPRIHEEQKKAIGYKLVVNKRNHERLRTFLENNLSLINSPLDDDLNTFLHIAVLQENARLVEFFLRKGSQLDRRNKHGLTPYACCKSDKARDVFIRFARDREFSDIMYKESEIRTPEETERLKWEKKCEEYTRSVRQHRRLSSYFRNKEEEKRIEKMKQIRMKHMIGWAPCETCQCGVTGPSPFSYLDKIFCSDDCFQSFKKLLK